MVETVLCVHCGAQTKHPVTKMIDGHVLNFCCGGCLQVYELMHDEGQNGKETPVQLQTEQVSSVDRRNEGTIPSKTITLSIAGMTCANCVAHVEGGLRSVHGVINVNVILATEHATVEITPGAVTIADLKHAVKDAGYEVLDVFDSGEA
jgi:copper chaperone CopZ